MPITISLYQKTIAGKTYAFDQDDISFGDVETKEVQRNIGTDIVTISLRKRQVTLTVRGANANDLASLYAEREANIMLLLTSDGAVTGEDITIGADTIYNTLLLDVNPQAPIVVAGIPLAQVELVYNSQVYV